MKQEGTIRLQPLLRFADSRLVSARKLLTRVGSGVRGEVLVPEEHEVYTSSEVPEDVQLLKKTYPIRLPKEAGEKNLFLDEELDIPASMGEIEKILGYWVCPELTEQKVLSDKVVFRGNLHLHMIGADPEGNIKTGDLVVPFSQFSELDGSYSPEAHAQTVCSVTSLELGHHDGAGLHLKCAMVCQYVVDDRELMELIEDAYSPRREVKIMADSLQLPLLLEERTEMLTAQSQISGHTGDVLDLFFLPDHPRQQRTANGIGLEVNGAAQVLYQDENGMLQGVNSRWDTNYSVAAGEDCDLHFAVEHPASAQAKVTGDSIEIRGQIEVRSFATTDQGLPMVTALELGELREPDPGRPSLVLCRLGAESLWSLAKRCSSTEEAIRQANHLSGDPDENMLLLIPVS